MRYRPSPPRLRAALGVLLLALALGLFATLAIDLVHQGPITRADAEVSSWLQVRLQPAFTQLMLALTHLHSNAGIVLMAATAAAVLVRRRQVAWVPLLVSSVGGGLLLNVLVKQLFQRARPVWDDPLLTLHTYSFPSGHTAGATVWWGFFTVLVFTHRPTLPWKAATVVMAIGMVCLTALSRVYLGVHHLSDVLAAAAEGCAWLVLCFMASASATGARRANRPTGRAGDH
ncbi:MAG: phosphatase PAP2 family protein [Ramlibacter sp.]|nr:phosphatase PAP2 family protein [Ramlibacter sp.]